MQKNDQNGYDFQLKQIIDKLRLYAPQSVLVEATHYLHKPLEIEEARKHPWLVMLLIKWAYIGNSRARKSIRHRDFRDLMNRAIRLQNATRNVSDFKSYLGWFRRLAYQQFPYQQHMSHQEIARQEWLFGDEDGSEYYSKKLYELKGFSVSHFSMFAVALLTHYSSEQSMSLHSRYFYPLLKGVPMSSQKALLEALSIDASSLSDFFEREEGGKRWETEYFEQTSMFNTPLLSYGQSNLGENNYVCLHRAHLFQCLKYYVYDVLRKEDANEFMGKFGNRFSAYIDRVLDYSEVDYFTEREIEKMYSGTGSKVVDYCVSEPDALIFIEVKGVEASSVVQTTPSSSVLGRRLKDSILKSIKQGCETLTVMEDRGLVQSREVFLMVVTFKQLYLSTGEILRECVEEDDLKKYSLGESGVPEISYENMFFVDVNEFDRLMTAVENKSTSIGAFLTDVKKDQESFENRKFHMGQFLDEKKCTDYPEFLSEIRDDMFDRVANSLGGEM